MLLRNPRFAIVYASAIVLALTVSTMAEAACFADNQKLPASAVGDFLGAPAKLLADPKFANGGAEMISAIRDLVASDPATLPAVIGLLSTANSGQQIGIGSGLGQAANTCTSDPNNKANMNFAADIQIQLASSNSDDAKTNFAAVTGNKTIRSVAAGGGTSGGSSGGGTSSNLVSAPTTPPVTSFSAASVRTISSNFFTSGTSSVQSIASGSSVSP